ncbi:angiogenic factor with G patch and FHA domains 1 isoform X1 [Homalodisca vitripennis]|uniref:angiogenic factor with G patch and FHA domains 1 isoform X1 n=1 Tax=Homalodisca vitripennis TaxID=197043 RepID=UPI001EEACE36|nr:angiogenic factor with G patch and FHA domains 1 isoform X1 [Homalodisca vitripennis]XP_046661950.1 angiogenic factor with G patch and FHA domains 1 isoform X1 [Homalodisca vitripennis]XP_046661951.1 angiogenic factor with G patch and FHA domains 1 isoform X1 [Homalodisca vitripennis]
MDESLKNNTDNVEEKAEDDFTTSNSIKEVLKDLPEVLAFIQRLQECILRQRSLIHKLYNKIKENDAIKKVSTKDGSTQTDEDERKPLPVEPAKLVQDIKEAAETAVQQTGFVYEATSGMYYDYNTGYYYNAELGLYYDGHNGIYYYFDEASKSFQFHSQVSHHSTNTTESKIIENVTAQDVIKKRKSVEKDLKEIPKKIRKELMEEGECTESSDESENEINEVDNVTKPIFACDTNENDIEIEDCKIVLPTIAQNILLDDEVANAWPPCLRIVVKETALDNLPVGSLFIVTCTGGTLGREGDHAVVIPDINISKHHAKVSYSETDSCYKLVDLGSRNGTLVDGRRLSVALRESDPVDLQHGTVVRVGCTELECHLHPGRTTCNRCEPGCVLHKESASSEAMDKDHETKEARHRSELRRLRKRFGLDKLSAKETSVSLPVGYQDRAEERRKTVGSQDHNAKTEAASVDQHIQSENKGFKMLSKMGWAKGQSLGKDSTKGIVEPVLVEQRPEKSGLGSEAVHLPAVDAKAKKKTEVWKKAQKRFQELGD